MASLHGPPISPRSRKCPRAPTPSAGRSRTAALRMPPRPTSPSRRAPRAARSTPFAAVELASWLRQNGHSEAALTLLRRVVRDSPRGEGLAEVYAATGLLLLEDCSEPTAAYQYLLTALELGPRPETEARRRRALQEIDVLQKRRVGRPHTPRPW